MNEAHGTNRAGQSFVARSFAALFGLGGLAVLASLALSHPADRKLVWLLVPALMALALAVGLLFLGGEAQERRFYLLPPFGSVLVTAASYGAGAELRVAYATFLFWSITSAFYFLPRRQAIPNIPLAWLLYGAVLLAVRQPFLAVNYLVPMAAVTASAVLIDRLNAQRERLAVDLRATLRTLEEQARTDPLTGLPNRREFARQLSREVARAQRSGVALAVLMIDLDRFKDYNDEHGHPAGDQLLREVARVWGSRLRDGDLLVRYGGDEFAVILPECRIDDARRLADRLRAPLPAAQACSVGAAAWLPDETGEQLVARADEALLIAKRRGRDETWIAEGGVRLRRAGGVSTGG
jgi:diguanylate cyclase (GGDEF)-like protein